MTGITISQLPDGATLDDTDLLEITRTNADGTQASMRVSASYITAWLTGKDVSGAVVVPTGSAPGTAGTALSAIAATANGAVQKSQVGANGGVAGIDASGNTTITGVSMAYGFRSFPSRPATFLQDPSATYYLAIGTNGDAYLNASHLRPFTDNVSPFGTAGSRWSQVYAGTGTINTSDATEKTLARATSPVTMGMLCAALSPLVTRVYQWNDMIAGKGADRARYHVGYLAQDVYALLVAANIDPTRTALWCNDALTQQVVVTPGRAAVTTTDPTTGRTTIVTPAVDPVYATQPVLNADGTQACRQGLRLDLVHSVLIEIVRQGVAALETSHAALAARVTALEAE